MWARSNFSLCKVAPYASSPKQTSSQQPCRGISTGLKIIFSLVLRFVYANLLPQCSTALPTVSASKEVRMVRHQLQK